jgi:hypothetical protein
MSMAPRDSSTGYVNLTELDLRVSPQPPDKNQFVRGSKRDGATSMLKSKRRKTAAPGTPVSDSYESPRLSQVSTPLISANLIDSLENGAPSEAFGKSYLHQGQLTWMGRKRSKDNSNIDIKVLPEYSIPDSSDYLTQTVTISEYTTLY